MIDASYCTPQEHVLFGSSRINEKYTDSYLPLSIADGGSIDKARDEREKYGKFTSYVLVNKKTENETLAKVEISLEPLDSNGRTITDPRIISVRDESTAESLDFITLEDLGFEIPARRK